MSEFDKHKEAFLSEAKDCLDGANSALLKLEKMPNHQEYLQEVFRLIHTLKSMAAAMHFDETAKLSHIMEDLLDAIKSGSIRSEQCIDELLFGLDCLNQNIRLIQEGKNEKSTKDPIEKLNLFFKDNVLSENQIKQNKQSLPLTIRLPIQKIQAISVRVEKLDFLLNLVEELFVNKMKLNSIKDDINHLELTATADSMSRIISDLQYIVMKIRMVSLDFIFNQFPRMVRDLAKQQNKLINLDIQGEDIELDRAIIDEINESLVHLIRNAVSHGIETKELRKKEKKPMEGNISIIASRLKESVTIEIKDDGAGINLEEIKKLAIKQGLLKPEDPQEKIMDCIFAGISTSEHVTSVSGRGLGLNIVKKKIESINGSISVKSKINQGTSFLISIPLSLAVIKSLFVKVNDLFYAIPIANVERLIQLQANDIKGMIHDEAIILEEKTVPLINLKTLFNIPVNLPSTSANKESIVVVKKEENSVGLIVDELVSTQDIVIKPLNHFVQDIKYFSGSTIIGSGEVILVLDINNLISSYNSKGLVDVA